eukprot:365380-Chlamydomonas_euryale.AAC.6
MLCQPASCVAILCVARPKRSCHPPHWSHPSLRRPALHLCRSSPAAATGQPSGGSEAREAVEAAGGRRRCRRQLFQRRAQREPGAGGDHALAAVWQALQRPLPRVRLNPAVRRLSQPRQRRAPCADMRLVMCAWCVRHAARHAPCGTAATWPEACQPRRAPPAARPAPRRRRSLSRQRRTAPSPRAAPCGHAIERGSEGQRT